MVAPRPLAPKDLTRGHEQALGESPPALPPSIHPLVRLGGGLSEAPVRLSTGIESVDRLLGGGFPRGHLSEITGPLSSGRTSLALALSAAATRAGEVVAWIDAAAAFDPASAQEAGVDLGRLLWIRASRVRDALRGAERLLAARGFALVVLDLCRAVDPPAANALAPTGWMRLARAAAASGTALAVLGRERLVGSHAALVVDLRAIRRRFATSPAWLEGIEARVALVRHRLGPSEGFAPVQWKVPPLARGVSARAGPACGRGAAGAS
jgi:hypothetical protein